MKGFYCVRSVTRPSLPEAIAALSESYYGCGSLTLGEMHKPRNKRQKKFVYNALVKGVVNNDMAIEVESKGTVTTRLYVRIPDAP